MVIKDVVSSFSFFPVRDDDDFVDRLHYFITTNVLLALTVVVSFKQFGGDPIDCMIPDLFPGSWEQYIENYCWAQGTYYLPLKINVVPQRLSDRYAEKVSYYQWVPFLLVFQAVCFALPAMFWGMFNVSSGINVTSIVEMAREDTNIRPEIRKNTIHILASHMENSLKFQRRLDRRQVQPHQYVRCLNLAYKPFYVTLTYLFTKCLYILNVLFQWELLRWFLGTNHLEHWTTVVNGTEWHNSGFFPRVTLCDFEVRQVGSNVQHNTVQCLLLINLFNEKIFIFLYFWFCGIALITVLSLIYWFWVLFVPPFSKRYVKRHLQLGAQPINKSDRQDALMMDKFIGTYLNRDGVFALRMISLHIGVIFATDLVWTLWRRYYGIDDEFIRFSEREDKEGPHGGRDRKPSLWRQQSLQHVERSQFDTPSEDDAKSEGSTSGTEEEPPPKVPATAPALDTVDAGASFAAAVKSPMAMIDESGSGSGEEDDPDLGLGDLEDWTQRKKQRRQGKKSSFQQLQEEGRCVDQAARRRNDRTQYYHRRFH